MKPKFLIIVFFLVTSLSCSHSRRQSSNLLPKNSQLITGKVVKIADGDTFTILLEQDHFKVRVRLVSIDSPERKQPFSKRAKQYLSQLIFGKKVKVYYHKKDRYGRVLGEVYVGNINVNEAMLKAGYAWHFKKYSKDKHLERLEYLARKNKKGLWSDPNPIPPWEWRKHKTIKK